MTNWKNKLLALLHDPPSKCLNIRDHRDNAVTLMKAAGFSEEEAKSYCEAADHTAAAADRFPFPYRKISCEFDGQENAFRHPLGGGKGQPTPTLQFHAPFVSANFGFETDQTIQPAINHFPENYSEDLKWRAQFFAHWRLFAQFATEKDYRSGFLPAETRLPDHTIWNHMQVVSALAGCSTSAEVDPKAPLAPAFLKFQIGPVQDFIAQARSTRDLWSGSYLLSWLMSAGLKALSAEIGPDAVIFPNLCKQPLFDLQWKKELWEQVKIGDKPIWDSIRQGYDPDDFLTPNLPNVFLAIVPKTRATELAKIVETAIRGEWATIAKASWNYCQKAGVTADEDEPMQETIRKGCFDKQSAAFLSIAWNVTDWPESLEAALKSAEQLPDTEGGARVKTILKAVNKDMPKEHRDSRYYSDKEEKTKLNNIGVAWSLLSDRCAWELDGVRQVRTFDAWNQGGWTASKLNNKDSLNGRDEAVLGGSDWAEKVREKGQPWSGLFKKDDFLGASTLIKRVWHLAYLEKEIGLPRLKMPNTRCIAAHDPFETDGEEDAAEQIDSSENYFAVLAFDGDEIGKWVSGEKTPLFKDQFADYQVNGERKGALHYFEENLPDFLQTPRLVSPSYHLQLSEALSNFALYCVRPIVESFDGRLIYAGGDDVLAFLPADTALDCAEALQSAFRGDATLESLLAAAAKPLLKSHQENRRKNSPYQPLAAGNHLLSGHSKTSPGFLVRNDGKIPFVVPGPAVTASVGIAIAHFKAPLQDVIREAQAAEKRAKITRNAVSMTLIKHSGETIEWGCQWSSGGLEFYRLIALAREGEKPIISAKFPYRFAELLTPYRTATTGLMKSGPTGVSSVPTFPTRQVIEVEFEHVLRRQVETADKAKAEDFQKDARTALAGYLDTLESALDKNGHPLSEDEKLRAVIGLCQTVAFTQRIS